MIATCVKLLSKRQYYSSGDFEYYVNLNSIPKLNYFGGTLQSGFYN